ncbi:OrfB_Zn_ribbon domain-containing protein [Pycnococcus provasolii]
MKWRHFVYTQRSEDTFIGRMRHLYGDDALVAYGNWSRTTQMRHFVPTKGVGMRRLISRHFETVSINEFRTSNLGV